VNRAVSPPCAEEVHAAFDFWIGQWDVFPTGGDTEVARSRIERLHGGCAIRENWMPLRGTGGGSLTNLDPQTGRWHQTWIGSSPGRIEFEGGPVPGGMVLTGYWPDARGPGKDGLVRMTYTALEYGAVRQLGEVSYDHGLEWEPSFDFVYRRRELAGD
jgi:hypothetical protein